MKSQEVTKKSDSSKSENALTSKLKPSLAKSMKKTKPQATPTAASSLAAVSKPVKTDEKKTPTSVVRKRFFKHKLS